jgi:dinuclear metal center YbgI/SA1388 family protein
VHPCRDAPFFIALHPEAGIMSVRIHQLLAALDQLAPFSLAEDWDNVGLLVGNPEAHVTAVLLGLDPGIQLLDEAIALGANTIITHHPVIFHPLKSILTNSHTGLLVEKALTRRINLIACHTNLDNAAEGVSDALACVLGLTNLAPLLPGSAAGSGSGRIGTLAPPLAAATFLDKLFHLLHLDTLRVAGKIPDVVKTVALCGGSGSEFAETAFKMGADLYLSAEMKHSTARWAEDCGFCIIDGTHYSTEQPAMPFLLHKLRTLAAQNAWSLDFFMSQTEKHPFTSIHKK